MKTLILSLFAVLCININAQLEKGVWQLQNPAQMHMSFNLHFTNGQVSEAFLNMNTGQYGHTKGTYRLSGNLLEIFLNGQKYSYRLTWANTNKIILSNSRGTLTYALSNTPEDQYMSNYLLWSDLSGNSRSGYQQQTPVKRELCYTCGGTGRCVICRGSGECSACYKTRKCQRCGGTGYER